MLFLKSDYKLWHRRNLQGLLPRDEVYFWWSKKNEMEPPSMGWWRCLLRSGLARNHIPGFEFPT